MQAEWLPWILENGNKMGLKMIIIVKCKKSSRLSKIN